MQNKGKIIVGLAVFIAVIISPFIYNAISKAKSAAPEVVLTDKAKAAKKCVRSADYMRDEHMQILDLWRESVVRNGKRTYVNSEGKTFNMSLSNTCLDCHSNKKEFCDRCHNYASVTPYCWECHIENPKGEENHGK